MLHALVALYGIGLLAAFNPCSLPLYPAFIASWSGSGGRPTAGAAAFVAGSTVSFVGLGIAAGSLGGALSVLGWLGRIAGASLAVAGLATLRRLALDRPGRTWTVAQAIVPGSTDPADVGNEEQDDACHADDHADCGQACRALLGIYERCD